MSEVRAARARRWWVVAAVTALLLGLPVALRSLPAADSDVSAAALLERTRESDGQAWSGDVATTGTLQLPDADDLSDLGRLFGEETRMRAWWQDDDHWRVDELVATGERGLRRDDDRLVTWDFERNRATVSRDPGIRLPRTSDLLPPVLAARLLRGVTEGDVGRLPATRVAGRSALGLRVEPASELSSIGHADLWVDAETSLPLRVAVHTAGAEDAAFTSELTAVDLDRPDDATVDLRAAPGVDVEFDDVLDIADAANQYAPVRPPAEVLGLPQAESSDRAVGVYGRGMTQFVAIPLRDQEAGPLREQLTSTPGVAADEDSTAVAVGPLTVVLSGGDGDAGWLLAGTLTREALTRAAAEVVDGFVFVEDDG